MSDTAFVPLDRAMRRAWLAHLREYLARNRRN
jgi:hypothetical protein